jgi:WD40 repeat protein
VHPLEKHYHQILAEYFVTKPLYINNRFLEQPNVRKYIEQPYQQTMAEKWDEVENTLCDLFFIEAKVKATMINETFHDYQFAAKYMPEGLLQHFQRIFITEIHNIRSFPDIAFSILYNQMQWENDEIKTIAEKAKQDYLKTGRIIMRQYHDPEITETYQSITLSGHLNEVTSCCFSPDDKKIVSASQDGTVKIWNSINGDEITTLKGNIGGITVCAISSTGKYIICGSDNSLLKIWDEEAGKELFILKGHQGRITSCAFSYNEKYIISGSSDHTLKIWDSKTGNELFTLKGHSDSVNFCTFSDNDQLIISGSTDCTLKIWDSKSGKELKSIKLIGQTIKVSGYKDSVNSWGLFYNGRFIALGSEDSNLRIFDILNGEEIVTIYKDFHPSSIKDCSISPDDLRIATAGGFHPNILMLWTLKNKLNENDVRSRNIDMERFVSYSPLRGHYGAVICCSFSHDGRRIVSGSSDNTLRIWELGNIIKIKIFGGHDGCIYAISISPDGNAVISAGDHHIKLWDLKNSALNHVVLHDLFGILSCSFSPDGSRIVWGDFENISRLWNVTEKDFITLWKGRGPLSSSLIYNNNDIPLCNFSPDGSRIIGRFEEHILKLFDAMNCEEILTLDGHDSVSSCVFSPDATMILSGSCDATLQLWDSRNGNELKVFDIDTFEVIDNCFFSPDGRKITLVNGNLFESDEGNLIKIINIKDGRVLNTLKGHTERITSCAFSPDNNYIIWVCT